MKSFRRYRASDHAAVIALFRGFMQELTPPHLAAQFETYVETAIREELGRIEGYRLERKESAAPASHKSVGAGLARYHYEKALA